MAVDIRIATSQCDREAIYRLRYEVYVEEMGRRPMHVDDRAKQIIDPLDEAAMLFGAFEGDIAVGTARLNAWGDNNLMWYPDLYGMEAFGSEGKQSLAVASKLMLHKHYRNQASATRSTACCIALGSRTECGLHSSTPTSQSSHCICDWDFAITWAMSSTRNMAR